jgi:Tfp pilus assembly protein PilZ
MFIPTAAPLPRGSRLELRFQLPGGGAVHALAGRVVWVNPPGAGEPRCVGMGLEFTDRAAISELARALDRLYPEPATSG